MEIGDILGTIGKAGLPYRIRFGPLREIVCST